MFCRSLFVLFHLTIVLTVLFRLTYSEYPFDIFKPTISLEMPVPSQGHYGFTGFRLLTDFACLYTYEFCFSLCKIVQSSVILLLPLLLTLLGVSWARVFFLWRVIVCSFTFDQCIVCPSTIYGFSFVILDLRLLIIPLLS